MGTSNKYAGGTYMKLHRRLYNLEHDIYLKDCTGLNDTQYELACYCKEHDIKQRRKYTYYYTMTHKTDGLTPEGFCVLYRQKNADKVACTVIDAMMSDSKITEPLRSLEKEMATPTPAQMAVGKAAKKLFGKALGVSVQDDYEDAIAWDEYLEMRSPEENKQFMDSICESANPILNEELNSQGILTAKRASEIINDSVERHLNKVETHKETLGDALNKKIKDNTVYKIYIKGDDLKQLTDILQTPAMKSQYRVEVIDNRIKIDSIPQKAQNDISDALRNLGVDEGTLQNLMPQIRRLSAEASKHARVLSDRDVKETSQNA